LYGRAACSSVSFALAAASSAGVGSVEIQSVSFMAGNNEEGLRCLADFEKRM